MFARMEASPEELIDDAEAIGKLELVSGPEPVLRSQAWTFTYPAQEHKISRGEVIDPATGFDAGDVIELDREARLLVLKRGPKLADVPLPTALAPGRPYRTDAQEDALMRIGRSLLAGDRRYPALESVLRRVPHPGPIQTNDLDELERLLLALDGGHLFIQGPPGSGKTWTGGRLIARLLAAGKRVGVASTSHKAIHKLLDEVEAGADELGLDLTRLQEGERRQPRVVLRERADRELAPTPRTASAGRSRRGRPGSSQIRASTGTLDYLFVDEGGQVSLADALAMGTCARNLVLIGDPMQLGQVLQGTHPEGAGASVLEHLLGTRRRSPRIAASSSSGRSGSTRTSTATSRRRSTRGGSSPTR